MGNNKVTPFAGKASSSCGRTAEVEEVGMEQQCLNFARLRGYPPRIVDTLPTSEGTAQEWEKHALLLSEREGYSYTLFLLAIDRYLLLRTCEQDFHYLLPGSGGFLRPSGQYLGWTHLSWVHGRLEWFFTWQREEFREGRV